MDNPHGGILYAPTLEGNADQIVFRGPCLVFDVTISAQGNNGYVLVYDGLSAAGTLRTQISTPAWSTESWGLKLPTDFDTGIFLDITGALCRWTVQYLPVCGIRPLK